MVECSRTHLVLIPSFNPGAKVYDTVREARRFWAPVWVVVDGSTDGTLEGLRALKRQDPDLRILVLQRNMGKGSAVLAGISAAAEQGFTHALTMDSDGQHPAASIPEFMQASVMSPRAVILGVPVFDASAPALRVKGRKISNWWANLETVGLGLGDSLYGFRVYPIAELASVMKRQRWMRRFDFDPEAAVRLVWRGVRPINIPAPVKYLTVEDGGVSHFNYFRDNVLLTWMHLRLLTGFVIRLPMLLARKRQARS
ncbi:MAG: glycosyltransferase family 2 protein [Pseudomonadota bacterium]|nr:glycosyltransferase family 2 protein [Pseudomonadota bacterium]